MGKLAIYHPYGTVGALPWQQHGSGVEFGAQVDGDALIDIAGGLRTFTQGIDPASSDILAIRDTVSNAERLAFIGFAFHRLNLQLLFPGLPPSQQVMNRPTYATATGISSSDIQAIHEELASLGAIFKQRTHLRNDLTSAQLFREFWRSLSLL